MERFKRICLIVLDSLGIGELPDAAEYGDRGADTLGHIADVLGGLPLEHLHQLGLGRIKPGLPGNGWVETPIGYYGRMMEISKGKDTTTGHWEMMGVEIRVPFRTYPDGFPTELIDAFKKKIGRGVLGNKAASGTAIIEELGEQHLRTGDVIVYTSADSVFQIAAHEEVVPLLELYRICEAAREMTLTEPYLVGRVIARPFVGQPGRFERTANRRDYSVKPPSRTVMHELADAGLASIAIGKIADIFDGEGITEAIKTKSNDDGVTKTLEVLNNRDVRGVIFTNLVDFDAKYGHRRDPKGYGEALQAFDRRLPELLAALQQDDLLIITADHGNDPTFHGTDHTREYVPLLAYSKKLAGNGDLGVRRTFADVGATVADNFEVRMPPIGESFLSRLNKN